MPQFFFMGGQDDEEATARMKMHRRDSYNNSMRFMESLDEEQSQEFLGLLLTASEMDEVDRIAFLNFWRGMFVQVMMRRFDQCFCGTENEAHTRDSHFQINESEEPEASDEPDLKVDFSQFVEAEGGNMVLDSVEIGGVMHQLHKAPEDGDPECDGLPVELFGLVPASNPDYLECQYCSHMYVSLVDRRLKPWGQDGCHGCQQASKVGSWNKAPSMRWIAS